MDRISVFDIANSLLTFGSMNHKKLQKLCFYAQAWRLALYKERLFDNYFEAWVHGPVCRDLYQMYKKFGWINLPVSQHVPANIDKDIYEFLKTVYDTYGGFSGDDLEVLTHSELPWQESRKGLEEWEPSSSIISDECMEKFYWGLYEASQND